MPGRVKKIEHVGIARVAQVAGVSKGTVSKVLSGSYRISESTRQKVLEAVEKLGYTPNMLAKYIATGKSNLIVYMIRKEFGYPGEPFYTRILLNFELLASLDDYWVLFKSFDGRNWKKVFKVALATGDVVVLVGKLTSSFSKFLISHHVENLLLVDYRVVGSRIPFVMPDNIKGGVLAAKHLASRGIKKAYFICGDMEHPGIRERYAGFKMGLAEFGLQPVLLSRGSGTNTFDDGVKLARYFGDEQIKNAGVMAANDAVASGFVRGLGERVNFLGGIVGFDDVFYSETSVPAITTLRVDLNLFAETAYSVVRRIVKRSQFPFENRIPVELIVRDT